jgi:hypothetical protein
MRIRLFSNELNQKDFEKTGEINLSVDSRKRGLTLFLLNLLNKSSRLVVHNCSELNLFP